MNNLITDILKSHFDFNENKTKIKSLNSGILENKVQKEFEFFNTKNGKFNFNKIVDELTSSQKKIKSTGFEKLGKNIAGYIYFIFFMIIVVSNFESFL